ncbi:hypothetical protein JHK85_000944 [Glycine max]|nr:hypothetical protein JHK85_000944 [Glycine max]
MGLGATATIDVEEPSSNTKGKRQGSTSSGTHSHKIEEKEGITTSLDKMANSFDRMVEKMDGKVNDEDIQEVLPIKWLAEDPKQLAIVKALPIREKTDYVLTHLAK